MNKKIMTIGFIGLIDFQSNIAQKIFSGVNQAAKDFNINLINFTSLIRYSFAEDIENYACYKQVLKYLNKNNINGFVSKNASLLDFMTKKQIDNFHQNLSPLPIVCIGEPIKNIPTIVLDEFSNIKELMTHLIKVHEFKKIAFIGSLGHITYQQRFEAYKKVLEINNIPYKPELVYKVNNVDLRPQIKNCLDVFFKERKLHCKKDIEAFITVSDIIAQGLIEELVNLGINVPEDITVLGYNNQLSSIKSLPPITTIDLNFYQLGYQAVSVLLSLINGEKKPDKIIVPSKLVIRQSCGCYEDVITKVIKPEIKNKNKANEPFNLFIINHYEELIKKIIMVIIKSDNSFNHNQAKELSDSLINYIMNKSSDIFLKLIKKIFFNYKNFTEEKYIIWQNIISEIRNLLKPYYSEEKGISNFIEDLFHQVKIIINVANSYFYKIKESDVYKESILTRIAVDLTDIDDFEKIFTILKVHLEELGIPGLYLSIIEEPKEYMDKSILTFIYNKNEEIKFDKTVIPDFRLIPKDLFPKNRQFFMIFDLLRYKGVYLGFILFEIGTDNIPVYNSLRMILSSVLYKILISQREKKILIHDIKNMTEDSKGTINRSDNKEIIFDNPNLNIHKIINYLSNHINAPTDLEKIAKDLNLSTITLMRKTKHMTGHTLQKLHEKLKIEKAKLLLENKILSISEITEQLGYKSQFYFSYVFKKNTGISPKKWAKFK